MTKSYINFFNFILDLKKEIDKQKLRGLNDYNILTSVLKISDEVNLHSKMIYSFLNPLGSHYQKDLFLKKFIQILKIKNFETQNAEVKREYKNIDIYITDQNTHIIIENKINASDQKEQIKRYIKEIKKENPEVEADNLIVVYLSKNRKKPTDYSLGDLEIDNNYIYEDDKKVAKFMSIHYKDEILQWIESSQKEVKNITNLNFALETYKEVVLKLTKKHKRNIMNISEEILKNKDFIKIALEIDQAEIKGLLLWKMFDYTIQNYEDKYEIQKPDYGNLANKEKCINFFKLKCNNKEKDFGISIFKKDNNDKKILIWVGVKNLHFGIYLNNQVSADNYKGLEKREWSFNWYSKIVCNLKSDLKFLYDEKYKEEIDKLINFIG